MGGKGSGGAREGAGRERLDPAAKRRTRTITLAPEIDAWVEGEMARLDCSRAEVVEEALRWRMQART